MLHQRYYSGLKNIFVLIFPFILDNIDEKTLKNITHNFDTDSDEDSGGSESEEMESEGGEFRW